jgi:hypothetical protein
MMIEFLIGFKQIENVNVLRTMKTYPDIYFVDIKVLWIVF